MLDDDFWPNLERILTEQATSYAPEHEHILLAVEGDIASNTTEVIDRLTAIISRLSDRRVVALRLLVASGLSYAQAAAATGLSRQRVHQIVNR
jgi:DNA-directed RNA polymerase specialized sigma24 family protein